MDFYQFNVLLHELSDQVYDGALDKNVASQRLLEAARTLPDRDSQELAAGYARDVVAVDPPPAARSQAVRRALAVVAELDADTRAEHELEIFRVRSEVRAIAQAAPEAERDEILRVLAIPEQNFYALWQELPPKEETAR